MLHTVQVVFDEVGAAFAEDVCFFAVHAVVSNGQLLVGKAERDATHVFDEAEDEGSPYDVPTDDEAGASATATKVVSLMKSPGAESAQERGMEVCKGKGATYI